MKKIISTILFLSIVFTIQAQDEKYNKWSADVRFGMNKPVNSVSMTSGYETTSPLSPWAAGAGVRYMMNNKVGLRLGINYNSFTNSDDSKKFDSRTIDVNLQGVANLGRIFGFENWTKRFGLLTHAGIGLGSLRGVGENSVDIGDDKYISNSDDFITVDVGFTPQFKISNKVSLFLDLALQMNMKQQRNFDTFGSNNNIGIQGFNYMATLGLNVYFGKEKEHADWFYGMSENDKLKLRIDALEAKVDNLSKDIDANKKGIAKNVDDIKDLQNKSVNYALKSDLSKLNPSKVNVDVARELINGGYINVYFGFNKSQPNKHSLWAVEFVREFLKKNPSVSLDVIGYADEIGTNNYNQRLSDKRANVVKALLQKAGVTSSLYPQGKGVDRSINSRAENPRQMARRVTFRVR